MPLSAIPDQVCGPPCLFSLSRPINSDFIGSKPQRIEDLYLSPPQVEAVIHYWSAAAIDLPTSRLLSNHSRYLSAFEVWSVQETIYLTSTTITVIKVLRRSFVEAAWSRLCFSTLCEIGSLWTCYGIGRGRAGLRRYRGQNLSSSQDRITAAVADHCFDLW